MNKGATRERKKKRRSTWRREVSRLEGLTLYYEVGFKVEVFRAGYPDRTPLLLCALVFARYITNSLSSRLYNFSLINAILYCDVRIKSLITILIWIMHIFKRQCSTPSEGHNYICVLIISPNCAFIRSRICLCGEIYLRLLSLRMQRFNCMLRLCILRSCNFDIRLRRIRRREADTLVFYAISLRIRCTRRREKLKELAPRPL